MMPTQRDMPRIYASERETARMLGQSLDWLHKNSESLEKQFGFPEKDPAINKRHVPSILVWAAERNARVQKAAHETRNVGKLDAL